MLCIHVCIKYNIVYLEYNIFIAGIEESGSEVILSEN